MLFLVKYLTLLIETKRLKQTFFSDSKAENAHEKPTELKLCKLC
tara:strand:- start:527 stop:658 length:132 start_codon:yes stop_codon:yes gene_type:complete